ncbi:SMP-30/gluconolactonase/LRE family protein [Tuwongella immobilis]|uniref:SMP-30/Gluconolactonase/LRE-like region domain-containing protein n=1 Tax=Tuwongella immobilis TaxID=692036 RepID=A0A6C2YN48_9BACT|nr:SMP-30/gluconolactonase/LRE family protein [Tuwongella immobilis]VIP03040.1 gluconolactonase : Gluconolactonase OS=Singulisphaera acidiphila (strain ATCC BAA-1392 / DSM 18658 / VKM B-2454 / MOB10) GN=Sinac_7488 PE=4 SV=1: SGL [Tuwongella immobilis]VTS03208.1 gluconolactonase : Gluconolactonase OS=Singulisphaera acidiphila (strain ATCC BAA-1392 / DSM 18658 / VKM B-2454 / MOB10) GN=Sinac_7488 PE=4 SV=1: SGL [Tuwongella immobilis]
MPRLLLPSYALVTVFLLTTSLSAAPIVPADAKLEQLFKGGEFTEGPAQGPDGMIYFSDIGNRILRYDPKSGKTTEFRNPSGRSNGLKFDRFGNLIACEGANTGGRRRISKTDTQGNISTVAERYRGKRFNSPNDLTIDTAGRIFFTDPRYVGDEPLELASEDVYRIDQDGTVYQIITGISKPNGIVITPNRKTLYLALSSGAPEGKRQLVSFPLRDDGTVGKMTVLHDFGADRGIDGMAIDTEGRIYATAGKKDTAAIVIFSPTGKILEKIPLPEDPSNCCFGGEGNQLLYITTAAGSLFRIKLNTTGISQTDVPVK